MLVIQDRAAHGFDQSPVDLVSWNVRSVSAPSDNLPGDRFDYHVAGRYASEQTTVIAVALNPDHLGDAALNSDPGWSPLDNSRRPASLRLGRIAKIKACWAV